VCRGLAHLHSIGVVHRDIKPANILLQRVQSGLLARIGDFGVARALEAEARASGHTTLMSRSRTVHQAQVAGTLAYMAPEYARPLPSLTGGSISPSQPLALARPAAGTARPSPHHRIFNIPIPTLSTCTPGRRYERPTSRGVSRSVQFDSHADGLGAGLNLQSAVEDVSQPPPSAVVAWATLPLFWRAATPAHGRRAPKPAAGNLSARAEAPSAASLLLNAAEHTLLLSPPPVSLPKRRAELPRDDAGAKGELTLCLRTARPEPPSVDALLETLATKERR
jgi:serine/threonine protein kinase